MKDSLAIIDFRSLEFAMKKALKASTHVSSTDRMLQVDVAGLRVKLPIFGMRTIRFSLSLLSVKCLTDEIRMRLKFNHVAGIPFSDRMVWKILKWTKFGDKYGLKSSKNILSVDLNRLKELHLLPPFVYIHDVLVNDTDQAVQFRFSFAES